MSTFACKWPDCGKKYADVSGLRKHREKMQHVLDDVQSTAKLVCPFADCNERLELLCRAVLELL
jgi:head-tail adaptor